MSILILLFTGCLFNSNVVSQSNNDLINCAAIIDNIPCNFSAIDAEGSDVEFYNLKNKPIVIDIGAMWCGPCQLAASDIQEIQDKYSEDELIYLTLLVDNLSGEEPTVSDLNRWKEQFDIDDAPVWSISRDIITSNPTKTGELIYMDSLPSFYFIDSDMKVKNFQRGYSKDSIESKIIDLLMKD